MVLEKRKSFMQKSGTKRSLFRQRLRLLHVMFDIVLIVCLVIFFVAWLVSNDWDCLMSLWKNHALFLLYGSIYLVFSFDALFGLTWRMLTPCWLQKSVAYSLYDHLLFEFWCHLMLLLMLLCRFAWLWPLLLSSLVAPSLLLALILNWVWALLVHPTPKNQVCHCVQYKFLFMVFASHSK
jgi:hypothetical protein